MMEQTLGRRPHNRHPHDNDDMTMTMMVASRAQFLSSVALIIPVSSIGIDAELGNCGF